MPLRFRLIALVAIVLVASLALGGAVTLLNASRSVQTEMRSALLVAQHTVDNAARSIDASPDPWREIDELLASFRGSRHLRVSVIGEAAGGEVQPIDDRTPFGRVPAWFARLVAVAPETARVPITIRGRAAGVVVITTVPRNEILEVWDELSGTLVVLCLFAGVTIPLIYLSIGRALRPLDRLAGAMEQFGQGDYAIRVSDPLTPELARLRDSFNRMTARLAAADADNRRLQEQLASLQEEERSDIARDLHDEVGPFLFAINVDVATMTRLINEGRADEMGGHLTSIGEAARHLQQVVRGMLGRLRPVPLAEFGLAEAIGGLVEFWRPRYPGIDFRVRVAAECGGLGENIDTTTYRLVQECLSNAVRHGKPRLIAISVARDEANDALCVEIADDGVGLGDHQEPGYGMIGMRERVRAIGGTLQFRDPPGGGLAVAATLPCRARHLPTSAMAAK